MAYFNLAFHDKPDGSYPRIFNDRKVMPSANFVRQITEFLPRTVFDLALIHIRLESPAVHTVHIIGNHMKMNTLSVGVNGEKILILAADF